MHVQWKRSLAIIVVLAASYTGAAPASARSERGGAALGATDVGVSPTQIRVAVLADVDTPAAPGLFQGSVDAVKGWARFMNRHGGLAGRKVVIDFIDTHLSADDARNAIIKACQEDFAIVGTSALFVNNVDDLVGCPDKAGNPTGLPDFPVTTTEIVHQCSTVSFAVMGESLDCSTKDDSPQTYRTVLGPTRYYLKRFGNLHGVFVYPSDLQAAKDAQIPLFQGEQEAGITADREFDLSGLAIQSAYTPVAQQLKESGSTYARSGLAFNSTVALRKEALLQGVTTVKVWDCGLQCYDRRLLEQGGADVEGQFVYVPFLPFEDAKANKMLATFLKFTGPNKADGFGVSAWSAGIFLRDVVEQVVNQGGADALTREAVLAAAPNVNGFDADGMIGRTDVGKQIPTPCYVLMQVKHGEFVRVHPRKTGTFDCDPRNAMSLELDLVR